MQFLRGEPQKRAATDRSQSSPIGFFLKHFGDWPSRAEMVRAAECGTKASPRDRKGAPAMPRTRAPYARKHMENASETRTTKPQRKLGHMLAIFKDLFAKLSPPLWLTIREVKKYAGG